MSKLSNIIQKKEMQMFRQLLSQPIILSRTLFKVNKYRELHYFVLIVDLTYLNWPNFSCLVPFSYQKDLRSTDHGTIYFLFLHLGKDICHLSFHGKFSKHFFAEFCAELGSRRYELAKSLAVMTVLASN